MKSHNSPRKPHLIIGLIVFVLLFVVGIWLSNYSSAFPIGIPKMTSQLDPVWSPDEKYLAFICRYSYPFDGSDKVSWNNPNWDGQTGEVCLVNVETREFKRLSYGRHKYYRAWSPDGTRLAWIEQRKGVMVYDIQTKVITPGAESLYDFEKDEKDDYLSPDGRYLIDLFGGPSATNEPYEGFLFHIMENEQVFFTSDFRIYPAPFWSPDGSILALRKSDGHDAQEVALMQFPEKEVVFIKLGYRINFLAWSPDGKTLAFQTGENLELVSFQFDKSPFSYSIVERRKFLLHGMVFGDILWSPKGRYITFIDYNDIWLLDLINETQTPLFTEN